VFQNEAKTIEFIRAMIMQNMRETALTKWKAEQNKDLSVTDLQILQTFGIEVGTISIRLNHDNSKALPQMLGYHHQQDLTN